MDHKTLDELSESDELLEVGRLAVEKKLIEFRDERIHVSRNNGLVIREKDGEDSWIIRFGMETGMRIALKAISKHLKEKSVDQPT